MIPCSVGVLVSSACTDSILRLCRAEIRGRVLYLCSPGCSVHVDNVGNVGNVAANLLGAAMVTCLADMTGCPGEVADMTGCPGEVAGGYSSM